MGVQFCRDGSGIYHEVCDRQQTAAVAGPEFVRAVYSAEAADDCFKALSVGWGTIRYQEVRICDSLFWDYSGACGDLPGNGWADGRKAASGKGMRQVMKNYGESKAFGAG